ncbi:hypothetical protein V1477_016201 [Vespula maculifrons]|uniref:Uncharacterized protein n=1 Tax=Vespula maculifrons TaxID=7453 RepID=A0ABD2BCH2_VESMC
MCYCVCQRSNGQEEGAIVVSEVRSKSMYGDVDEDEDGGDDRNGSGGGLMLVVTVVIAVVVTRRWSSLRSSYPSA